MKDIFWIKATGDGPNTPLAIVLRPRGGDWLEDELRRIKLSGVRTLVSMLENWEAESLGLADEGLLAERSGLSFLSYPIADRTTPSDIASFEKFVRGLADSIRAGESIGVHCRGSIGRATIVAASILKQLGWSPKAALAAIEEARGCAVPDTDEQRDWILRYEARP